MLENTSITNGQSYESKKEDVAEAAKTRFLKTYAVLCFTEIILRVQDYGNINAKPLRIET